MIAQTFEPETTQPAALRQKRKPETGFPSPAADHLEERLNLHDYVVRYPASTFFVKVKGGEEAGLGLNDGDILVVDRSMAPRNRSLVIAELEGEYRVCRLVYRRGEWFLEKGNGDRYRMTFDSDQLQTPVWGRVTHVVHTV